jgi:hypothetical protein
VPYTGHCDAIAPDYRKLVGLNLTQDFRRHVRERLGGTRGCSHMTELTTVLPTAAIQAFAGEVIKTQDLSQPAPDDVPHKKPFQLDSCYALRTDGPAVAQFYPRWHRSSSHGAAATEPSVPSKNGLASDDSHHEGSRR